MRSPFVYLAGDRLSGAELTAACLDGDVMALGEAFVPADIVESVDLRAATLSAMLGDSLAASHLSAAWVHGGIDTVPRRHSVQRSVPRRLHHLIDRRFVYHDRCVAPEDVVALGGTRVTAVDRTVADLARMPSEEHRRALEDWRRTDRAALDAGLTWLAARPRLPNGRRATALLEEVVRTT